MAPPGRLRSATVDPLAVSLQEEERDHARLAKIRCKILKGHSDAVTSCHFCFDDTKIISGSCDGTVKLWDIVQRVPIQIFKEEYMGPVSECCLSLDNKRLITASYDKTLRAWDTETGKVLGHEDWVTDAAVSGNKKLIVTSSKDCALRLWDIENANEIPVVIQAIRARGSKIAKCEECEKAFLIFQEKEDKVETRCVFCRLKAHKSVLPVPPSLPADL